LIILPVLTTWSQGSERLRKEQKELEARINTTKSLLEKSKKNTKLSLDELRLYERQVNDREQLLRNINNQIRSSELKIEQKQTRIAELQAEIEQLKGQYAELLIYAYKKRSKYGDLMFIFSAESVEEALKRKVYLEKLAEIQQKQLRLIKQNMKLMEEAIVILDEEKKEQLVLAGKKKEERAEIIEAKKEKEKVYQQFKAQEEDLLSELEQQRKQKAKLKEEIQAAIQRELAAERARLEKQRLAEERRRREAEQAASEGQSNTPTVKEEDNLALVRTAENKLVGTNFAANKGKLPWPVESGTITQGYGKNPHPTLPGVYTQNNGVDMSAPRNANVRAVFQGEVTSVINIPGAGKVVIIKHGDYRSVYSNLQDVYVTKGSKVELKTPIGSLLPNPSGNISVAHFEIHQVKGTSVVQLNPDLWISK
jgi:septal ring factor EnvC (AmiA/AmiB activator)